MLGNAMTEQEEITGTFKYEKDTQRFHRYGIKVDGGIEGSLYMPQDIDKIPDRIVLEKEQKAQSDARVT